MTHWTDHHIKENEAGTFDAFDEAGLLYSTHATHDEARDALVLYDAIELKVINQLPDANDLIREALHCAPHGAGPGEKALAEVAAQHIRRLGKQLTYKEDLCTRQRHLEAKLQGEINDLEDALRQNQINDLEAGARGANHA